MQKEEKEVNAGETDVGMESESLSLSVSKMSHVMLRPPLPAYMDLTNQHKAAKHAFNHP